MTTEHYDYKNFKRYEAWSNGPASCGALKISGHPHICAIMHTVQSFTKEAYIGRLEIRGQPRFDSYGSKLKTVFAPCTKRELMYMDMDHILSAIFCPNGPGAGWFMEVFTNDREDPEWIELVRNCPYAKLVYEIPSRMGAYNVQCWLFGRNFAK